LQNTEKNQAASRHLANDSENGVHTRLHITNRQRRTFLAQDRLTQVTHRIWATVSDHKVDPWHRLQITQRITLLQ